MRHGDHRPSLATARGYPPKLRTQIGGFAAPGSLSSLGQRLAQPAAALAGLPTQSSAGALVIARTDPRPRCQMFGTRKALWVAAHFRHHYLGHALTHPRNGIQQFNRLQVGLHSLLNAGTEVGDGLVQIVDMLQVFQQHKPMMILHPSLQRFLQLRALLPQPATRQVGQHRWVGLTFQKGGQHCATRCSQHIRCDCGQLDVGILQHFLEPVGDPSALLHETTTMPRQIAQGALLSRRDEAAAQQAVAQQIGQPFRIADIGLAAGHGLHMLGVDDEHVELTFQQVIDRPPVDAGAFHHHMRAASLGQPIRQGQQVGCHGSEGSDGLVRLTRRIGNHQASYDRLLVDIQATAALIDDIHQAPPHRPIQFVTRQQGAYLRRNSSACFPNGERQTVVPAGTRIRLRAGSQHQFDSTSCAGTSGRDSTHFHSRWWPERP